MADDLEVLAGATAALDAYSAGVQKLLELWSALGVALAEVTEQKAALDAIAAQVGLTLPDEPAQVGDVRSALA